MCVCVSGYNSTIQIMIENHLEYGIRFSVEASYFFLMIIVVKQTNSVGSVREFSKFCSVLLHVVKNGIECWNL